MKEDQIPIVRRQSGGGTVYHDFGNLNYTILSPKKNHNVKANLNLVCNTIKKLGLNAYPNNRNDIVIDHNSLTYKVSGSAFREKKDRAFHHGTLLINTDTEKLYNYLHQPIDESLTTKGVKSHRSKVINLAELKPDLQTQDITKAFLTNFGSIELSLINEQTPLKNKKIIDREIKVLEDWSWRFGKTLPFTKDYRKGHKQLIAKIQGGFFSELNYNHQQKDISNLNIKVSSNANFEDLFRYF